MKLSFLFVLLIGLFFSCTSEKLEVVTVESFSKFVEQTGYVTDAEKFDWSIVQHSIMEYEVLGGINWRCPNGSQYALPNEPVTQISFHDALAYSNWANVSIPSYEAYWDLVRNDIRSINQGTTEILPVGQVNIVGNTWEITTPDKFGRIRLAGGSYLCDQNTCNGINPERQLFVDQITGNTHIGFAVISNAR